VFVEHRDRDRTLPGLLGTGGQRGGRSSGGGDGGDSEKRAPGTRKAHWDTPSGEYSVLRLGYDRYEDLRGSIAKSARGRCTTETQSTQRLDTPGPCRPTRASSE